MFKRILRNETGQMAVFIALIFQVLFVLFAMVINIGLIVHDKINLQNSVDLAAYYAASKQAEELNMIAHINYQMRQDYKLLAWRYRVLGSYGENKPFLHPAADQNSKLEDSPWSGDASVCVGHLGWKESAEILAGNECRDTNLEIPPLLHMHYIPFSPPINMRVVEDFTQARLTIQKRCEAITPVNWALSSIFITAFKYSGGMRKKLIQKLASNISQKDEMIDLTGESVRDGAIKTLTKNFTFSNKQSFEDKDFELINGLGSGGCEQSDELGFPAWLQEIPISPTLLYTDLEKTQSGGCQASRKYYNEVPEIDATGVLPANLVKVLKDNAGEDSGRTWNHSSRGFEKNPWCLAYVGVRAKTKPRKPFAPFGTPIVMEAKAFAEPFGGRVGPWYGTRWPAGADQSDGSERTDPLAVPRGDFDKKYSEYYLPNYSRYPGDKYGLKSRMALGMLRKDFLITMQNSSPESKFSYGDYLNIPTDVQAVGDPLAFNPSGKRPNSRRPELLAVTPDLFDITYYSIDPTYNSDFYSRAQKTFQNLPFISDVGYRADDQVLSRFRIMNQIAGLQTDFPDAKDVFYIVADQANLLTGWLQGGAMDYSTDSAEISKKFGECDSPIELPVQGQTTDKPRVPGNCADGGRVGYSVRLVHKDYLLSSDHELGGSGAGKAKLKNAPPADF